MLAAIVFAFLPAALSQTKATEVERVLSAWMSKQGIPGLSAAIAVDGEIVWSGAYGLADVENFVPAKTTTAYRSASIGKSITATAAMQLVEASKLDLDAPVQRYCPAFPAKQWPLTTRNLLHHTSGIRHYGGPHDQQEQLSNHHYATVIEALAPFRNDPLLFEPGTQYAYSTYGYDVVGCVVEGAAKMPFLEAMRKGVFERAGMTNTRDDDPSAIIPNRAAGYIRINGELRNAAHVDMSNRLPAGGYATTALDLAHFAMAFIDCKLVSCATRDAMLTPQSLPNGDTVSYGLGWAVSDPNDLFYGEHEALHGGSSPGVSGMLYTIPHRRFALAVLTNLELAPERSEMAAAIAEAVLDLKP